MHLRRNLYSGRRKYLAALMVVAFISVICVAFPMDRTNFDSSRREMLLRRIGHEVLLQSGDSVSRVLPVKRLAENEYEIPFEHAFTFRPDSLVHTTQRWLAKDPLGSDYIVNVLNCADGSVAYGYAISKKGKDDIVACIGRRQPVACYLINIKFGPRGITIVKHPYFLAGLLLLGFVAALLFRSVPRQSALPENGLAIPGDGPAPFPHPSAGLFTLGAMSFDAEGRKLVMAGNTIDLTKTETRVLRIFAAAPNEVIERSRLQKEIWEDEGVIVGRSLDMFISKLRKKLEGDPGIKIAVIRGKGYKLQVSASENLTASD